MRAGFSRALLAGMALSFAIFGPVSAQVHVHPDPEAATHGHDDPQHPPAHEMWMTALPGGWHLMGMAHVFPSLTFSAPFASSSGLTRNQLAFPHAAMMANLESPTSRWVLRLMPNFEGVTLSGGEVSLGGWGEGFIDARHPHTLVHEAMLSLNVREVPGGAFSVSMGRGFAPYGTGDPMYRPVLKYPTNHHLSQILERWTASVAWVSDAGPGIEFGIFDGDEPTDWLDVGNIGSFGNSWSGRLSWRFGPRAGITAPWEVSASYARVRETHGDATDLTELANVALRHEAPYRFGRLYGLVEASRSDPEHGEGYFSVLGEVQLSTGAHARHRPFYRVEVATRPEYRRDADEGTGFFRYDHDDHAAGATRWVIHSVGYGFDLTALPVALRPFVEVQHAAVKPERGPMSVEPRQVLGGTRFWSFTVGTRVFLGGGPMRMGTYGVLDPMSAPSPSARHTPEATVPGS